MNDEIRFAKGMMFPWGDLNYTAQPNPQILQDYSRYVRILSGSVYLDPTKGTVLLPAVFPGPEVAGNEEARVEGDPHVTEADGGHFDFQGEAGKSYNLFNDTGLVVNAKFQKYQGNDQVTTIQSIGMTVSGPGGTSLVQINSADRGVTVGGRWIDPGRSVGLVDGGTLTVSQDGKTVALTTREGYTNTVEFEENGSNRYLNYKVRSSSEGVARDWRMPGGLVGHTFDGNGIARNGANGAGANGEGAIDGTAADYEVPGGLFGFPKPQVMRPGAIRIMAVNDPIYTELLGLPQGGSFALVDQDELKRQWDAIARQSIQSSMNQQIIGEASHEEAETKKRTALLQAALNSGNFDLAVIFFAGMETHQANNMAQGLMDRLKDLQGKRNTIAQEMAKSGTDAEGSARLNTLNTQASDLGTEIQLIQMFLQDVLSTKKESLEFASQAVRSSHETSQAIIQNIGR